MSIKEKLVNIKVNGVDLVEYETQIGNKALSYKHKQFLNEVIIPMIKESENKIGTTYSTYTLKHFVEKAVGEYLSNYSLKCYLAEKNIKMTNTDFVNPEVKLMNKHYDKLMSIRRGSYGKEKDSKI